MSTTEDQHPIKALTTDSTDEALGEGVCSRCPDRREDRLDTLSHEDLVETAANPVSRSRIRNRTGWSRSSNAMVKFLACWTNQDPMGCAVTPVTYTRRVPSLMKKST